MNRNYKNAKIISIAVLAGLAFIIAISALVVLTSKKPVDLYNIDQVDTGLSTQEISDLEKYIWENLKTSQHYINKSDIKVLIRPSSFSKRNEGNVALYTFLIDVDEFKATYEVSFGLTGNKGFYEPPTITCALPSQMKYPGTGCSGRKPMTFENDN